ncbi:MAG TPA: hypothetical protein DDY70_04655 [Clostridiales bacterium]|nr:hypothetical protein [Clostridiales bacterium]
MRAEQMNPYLRAAMIQPAIMEGRCMRMAYDNRLFYTMDGNGTVITEQGEEAVTPHTIMFFAPGYGYHFRGKLRMLVLNFDLTRKADDQKMPLCPDPVSSFLPSRIFDDTKIETLPQAILKNNALSFRSDLLETVRLFHEGGSMADAMTSAILKKTIASFTSACEDRHAAPKVLCENIRRYLHIYIPQIKGNEDVARHFGYHPVYLSQLYRQITGTTLYRAILSERVRLAEKWLLCTDQSIDEIAFGVGFQTRSHFCTFFKQQTGLSPALYRKTAIRPIKDD